MSADVEERSGQPSSHADSPASTSARPSAAARNPRIRQRPAVAVTKQRTVTQSTAPTGGKLAKTKQDGSTESLQSHNKTAANGPASSSQFVSKQFSTKRPAGETISGAKLVELAQLAVQDAAKMKDLEQMSLAQPDLYAQLILEVFKSTQVNMCSTSYVSTLWCVAHGAIEVVSKCLAAA